MKKKHKHEKKGSVQVQILKIVKLSERYISNKPTAIMALQSYSPYSTLDPFGGRSLSNLYSDPIFGETTSFSPSTIAPWAQGAVGTPERAATLLARQQQEMAQFGNILM